MLCRNDSFRKLISLPESEEGTTDLLTLLPHHAIDILKGQLEAESRGLAIPYINFGFENLTQEKIFVRFYPCVVYPAKGSEPLFSAIYSTEVFKDSIQNYYEFCQIIMQCTHPNLAGTCKNT